MTKLKRDKALSPTPGEMRLLRALWSLGDATVEQIVHSFAKNQQPNYKTTHTLLRIMGTKGLAKHTARGKVFFVPTVAEREVSANQVHWLLNQTFGGSAKSLLANLIEFDSLKGSELKELEQLIHRHRQKKEAKEPVL